MPRFKKKNERLSRAIRLAAPALAMGVALPAMAEEEAVREEVVVVGSQIQGVDIAGQLPVSLLDSADIADTGAVSGDELLRSIPQVGSVGFAATRGGSTGVNAARGDAGSVNLRSLDEGNTLVMVNGRRMVNHPITQTSTIDSAVPVTTVNSNTLPVAGLQRVEVLRDGAAALYGSDAVAGVVNYVLRKDYEGAEISLRLGTEEASSRDDYILTGATGLQFNDGATNVLLTGSFTKKNGINANEKSYAGESNFRTFAPLFSQDSSLDNRSSLEVTPSISVPGLGTLHLRPTEFTGEAGDFTPLAFDAGSCGDPGDGLPAATSVFTTEFGESVCLDSGSHNRGLRPNRNEVRTLSPDIERFNFFGYVTHEFGDGMEAYGEVAYYYSKAYRHWEQASILSNGRFEVPADYYWNPLGPVTFDDGRVNPNRLPGLDTSVVPEEGLGFELLSLRPVGIGTRNIEVEGESYRILGGLKGSWGDWDWDTAILHSEATVEDTASNRISTPLLQASLRLDTDAAYNIFTGIDASNPSSVMDPSVNPRSRVEPFIVSSTREAETTLTLFDFKVSNATLFSLPAGDVAIGAGFEYREEELDENNSSIFDGSMPFIDPLDTSLAPGEVTNASSLQGSSVRPDLFGERDVISVYGELIVPLVADVPAIHSLDMQLAVRHEDFSDVGKVTRPKVALSWYPVEWLQFRGAYSEGFRAPNLLQLNLTATELTTSVDDFAEGILLGTGDINDGPPNGNYLRRTEGNSDLAPEDSENKSFGIVLTPTEGLTITVDWWEIEQTGTVGVFGAANESRLDAILRDEGSFNPNVVRGPVDADNPLGQIVRINQIFRNLDTRTIEGIDVGVNISFDNDLGGWDFKVNTARMLTFDTEPGGDAARLLAEGVNPSNLGGAGGSLIEGQFIPKLRGTGSMRWTSPDEQWSAGVFVKYIGKVTEPSVTAATPVGGTQTLEVDDDWRVNMNVKHKGLLGEGSSITLGINNVFNEDPPFADDTFGFEGRLHSSRSRYFYVTAKKTFGQQ